MRLVSGTRNAIAWTGTAASLITATYCVHELCYFYINVAQDRASCAQFQAWFVMRGISNILAFLHLFLRANAVNAFNPKWPPWRCFGIVLMLATVGTIAAATVTRTAKPVPNPPFPDRCEEFIEPVPFTLNWIAQLLCHVFFAAFFIWPLRSHMRDVRAAHTGSSVAPATLFDRLKRRASKVRGAPASRDSSGADDNGTADFPGGGNGDVYQALVTRAFASLTGSALFTLLAAVLSVLSVYGVLSDVPVVGFSILDNGFTLASIYFANSAKWNYHNNFDSNHDNFNSNARHGSAAPQRIASNWTPSRVGRSNEVAAAF
ncbi:hypothetical protein JKP88DRAFT_275424 [Tribonema minus]|uniref:Uncharacterized protein n=1 Tax=Tribonema minus TaxID=303371 RepID=A0A835Z8K2_9STRA|nr:hypothetical protein JKP88DRAFT_275424 [Tribonema minus]